MSRRLGNDQGTRRTNDYRRMEGLRGISWLLGKRMRAPLCVYVCVCLGGYLVWVISRVCVLCDVCMPVRVHECYQEYNNTSTGVPPNWLILPSLLGTGSWQGEEYQTANSWRESHAKGKYHSKTNTHHQGDFIIRFELEVGSTKREQRIHKKYIKNNKTFPEGKKTNNFKACKRTNKQNPNPFI